MEEVCFAINSTFIFVNLGQRLQDSVSLLQHVDSVTFCLRRSPFSTPTLKCRVGALQWFVHAAEVPQRGGNQLTISRQVCSVGVCLVMIDSVMIDSHASNLTCL
jgi:hypothetical protein